MDGDSRDERKSRRDLILGFGITAAALAVGVNVSYPEASYIPLAEKGSADGLATLDQQRQVSTSQIPSEIRTRTGARPVGQGEAMFNVMDFGALGDGETDDTAAFDAAKGAASHVRGVIFMPFTTAGYVLDGFVLDKSFVTLAGGSGAATRFGDFVPNSRAAVTVLRKMGSEKPVLTLNSSGLAIRDFMIDGRDRSGANTLLVSQGNNEVQIDNVRVVNSGGNGLDVQSACNTNWSKVFVYNCGANDGTQSTFPAVRVCPVVTDASRTINTWGVSQLNIEYSQGVSLEVGNSLATALNYPEFLFVQKLHIEAVDTYASGVANKSWPLVRIVNCRNVVFEDIFLYGGPYALLTHEMTETSSGVADLLGHIHINSGSIVGRKSKVEPQVQPETLIRLISGNHFVIGEGVNLQASVGAAISIDSGYGQFAYISDHVMVSQVGSLLDDRRLSVAPAVTTHPVTFEGGITSRGSYTAALAHAVEPMSIGEHEIVLLDSSRVGSSLPAARGILGRRYVLKNTSDVETVLISALPPNLIDGKPDLVLKPRAARTVVSDGAHWNIVAAYL